MRDIINKNVGEVDILGAAEEAVRSGKTTLKLYFMIGLPWEEDEDASAIAALCIAIRDRARGVMGSRSGRLKLNVSVNCFIPKPFTPFQWAGMATRETLLRRQALIIRDRLRTPGIRVSFSKADAAFLEASLARGDDAMSGVIEEAWRRGARLDSWSEQFRGEAWAEAFALAGTSAEEAATARLELDQPLPWDIIDGCVDKGFLQEEWRRAEQGQTTPDCRWDGCGDCGICEGTLGNVLAAQPASAQAAAAAGEDVRNVTTRAGVDAQRRGRQPAGTGPRGPALRRYFQRDWSG